MLLRILVAAIFWAGTSCTQTPKRSDPTNPIEAEKNLARLTVSLNALLPLVLSHKQFYDPKNFKVIEGYTREAAQWGAPQAWGFSADMEQAATQLRYGDRAYARILIAETTGFCISCARYDAYRTGSLRVEYKSANLTDLTPFERAQFYLAARQSEKAFEAFNQALNAQASFSDAHALEVLTEKVMGLLIREKKDIASAREVANRILDSKWAPIYLRLEAREWKKSIQEWQNEQKARSGKSSADRLLASSKELLQRSWRRPGDGPKNRAGLVEQLRAASQLQDIISMGSSVSEYAEAFLNAGLVAEALAEVNTGNSPVSHYEACIRAQPYSSLAKRCYVRLEALQVAAHMDAASGELPAATSKQLRDLKALAEKGESDLLEWGIAE